VRRSVGIGGRVAALACAAALLTPAGAGAQQGNGLYDPFPDPTTSRTAERYYGELGVAVTGAQLDAGRVLPGLPAAAGARGPSARAGVGTAFPDSWAAAVLGLAALLVVGGAVTIVAWRR